MSDLNRVFIIGRLTRDPEMRHTQTGTACANFSVANNKTWTQNGEKKEQVSFFNCIAWGKLGELICQYQKKGSQVAVEGRLQQRSWDDQNGNKRSSVEIVAENVQFLGGKEETQTNDSVNPFSDDDLPF